ncbi:hypothetical protein HMN09_00824200 [Mycena chlorophos]|uniref:Uncharacterized protein n=1 Tax=Mycena chlorophos TaxID=658473 RepID=A0A8H6W441_MYCCL|nr:hypothetical protein HMN09_00824200 [Mycena chlorophos]
MGWESSKTSAAEASPATGQCLAPLLLSDAALVSPPNPTPSPPWYQVSRWSGHVSIFSATLIPHRCTHGPAPQPRSHSPRNLVGSVLQHPPPHSCRIPADYSELHRSVHIASHSPAHSCRHFSPRAAIHPSRVHGTSVRMPALLLSRAAQRDIQGFLVKLMLTCLPDVELFSGHFASLRVVFFDTWLEYTLLLPLVFE